ncbi:MAG TPA: hypothetical protein PKA09_11495, partial [Geminicoccus sp.]|nr:hypothetical protein [Geminicoccus sp.]
MARGLQVASGSASPCRAVGVSHTDCLAGAHLHKPEPQQRRIERTMVMHVALNHKTTYRYDRP